MECNSQYFRSFDILGRSFAHLILSINTTVYQQYVAVEIVWFVGVYCWSSRRWTRGRCVHTQSFTYATSSTNVGNFEGYPNPQPWIVSAFNFENGDLYQPYLDRLNMILAHADTLEMIPIIQFFYWGQSERFHGNNAAINASITNILDWLLTQQYSNILIDVVNVCNAITCFVYEHTKRKHLGMHELSLFKYDYTLQ